MTSPNYRFNPDTGEMEYDDFTEVPDRTPGSPTDTTPGTVSPDDDRTVATTGLTWDALRRFITSPAGIAGLGGAALGYLDRPKPSGGGTTMAYPGAAQLERKMVQGPYGPLAEYTGVGGGTPDYTPFTAPKVEFPTVGPGLTPPSGSGMSMQAKVDYYNTLKSYGLSDDRIRRIAETIFGPQTDAAWASLKNAVGSSPAESGIAAPVALPAPAPRTAAPVAAPVAAPAAGGGDRSGFTRDPNVGGASVITPWYNSKTGQTYMAPDSAWSPPNSDWVQGTPPAAGGGGGGGAPANPAVGSQQPSYARLSRNSSPAEISAAYSDFVASRGGDTEANRAEALQFLQGKGIGQLKINAAYDAYKGRGPATRAQDPFVTAVRNATKDSDYTDVSTIPVSTILDKNPIIAQTIDRIKQIDPSVVINDYDIGQFAGAIQEVGPETAVKNFIGQKRRMVGFYDEGRTAPWWERHTMADPTYKAYTELSHSFRTKGTQEDWDANTRRLSSGGERPLAVWRDPTSGTGIAVFPDSRGQPAIFTYLSEDGTNLTSTAFNAADLHKYADELGMDLSNIGQLGDLLDEKKVKYKPYELYQGTGSDHGINFQDIAQGGMGTAYDWTKDPLAHLKGPTGVKGLQANQQLASRLGITANPFVTTGRGLDPSQLRTYEGGADRRPWVAYDDAKRAAFFRTEQEAKNYAAQQGGTYTRIANLDQGSIPSTNFAPNTSGLDLGSSTGIANAYDQFLASQQGGDTEASRAQAQNFLQSQGVAQPLINQAYDVYKNDLTGPTKIASRYNEFISARGGDTEANRNEALQYLQNQGIGQPMINQAYDVFKQGKFAHGGHVQMEDGGFVMTKRAVDGAGGPRGIQQLVPGARMIRGPGHGTSDSIPAVINGPNGQTPARLSNGEAYVPPGRNTKGLYALMHQLERKA